MDKKLKAECMSLLLLFAAFPITSLGATGGNRLVWWMGLALSCRRRPAARHDALHGSLR